MYLLYILYIIYSLYIPNPETLNGTIVSHRHNYPLQARLFNFEACNYILFYIVSDIKNSVILPTSSPHYQVSN